MRYFAIFFFILSVSCNEDNTCDPNIQQELNLLLKKAHDLELPYAERNTYNEEALKILLKRKIDSTTNDNLLKVSWNFICTNYWEEAKSTTKIVFERVKNTKDLNRKAKCYRYFGFYFENKSINDSAFYYYLKSEKLYRQLNNKEQLCKVLQDKAVVLRYVNDCFGSNQLLVNSLRIAKKMNLPLQQYNIYYLLGLNTDDLQDYVGAIEYYQKAQSIQKSKLNQITAKGACIGAIANSYLKLKDTVKAIHLFREALKDKELRIKDPGLYCFTMDNLAYAKLKSNDLKIYCLLDKSAKIRNDLNIEHGKNLNKLYFSEYYYAIKDTIKAKQFAHEAFNLSKSFRAPKDMLICLKQLSKVEPQNALKYANQYITISDSMQRLERETRNKFAKIAYETEEITNEKEAAVKQKWIFLGITILVVLIGGLLFVVIYQRSRQKQMQFIQEQQKSNEEIFQLIQSQQTKINEGRLIEKRRIAQDLHDGIMNKLSSTRLNLHILSDKSDRETIIKCLPYIDDIQKIEKEIRNIAHGLHQEIFKNADSFTAVIESLFEKQKTITTTKCHLEIAHSIAWDTIESTTKIHIYRILQEALNNINKHAHAKNVVVSFISREEDILFEIYDDGIGFSLNGKKKGIGLQNIYSRTAAFNGSIEIKSEKATGTLIRIVIPNKPKIKTA